MHYWLVAFSGRSVLNRIKEEKGRKSSNGSLDILARAFPSMPICEKINSLFISQKPNGGGIKGFEKNGGDN